MADLTSAGVATDSAYELGDRQGKYVAAVKRVTLTLAGQGDLTDKITAASLGFSAIHSVEPLVKSDNSEQVFASVSYDRTNVILWSGVATIVTKTGTYKTEIKGEL
jgi:hypothetical protein